MIHPYFLYCNIVWGGASQLALKKLVCLQKRALRMITLSHYREHSSPLFACLNILKLSDIYKLQVLLFMYKAKNNLLPNACAYHITLSPKDNHYQFRKPIDFCPISFHTQVREKYIAVIGPQLWNSIDMSIKSSVSISIFKKRLVFSFLAKYA